jgi:putative ABC transport system permease protein
VVYLQLAIFALAAILIGMALVNVLTAALLSAHERLRVIGTLRAVGMTPSQVTAMVITSAAALGLAACLVGIPGGLALTRALLTAVSRAYGFGQVHVTLGALYPLALVPAMVSASAAGSLVPGRWVARLPIVQVLHYE